MPIIRLAALAFLLLGASASVPAAEQWYGTVYPNESRLWTDPETGAEVRWITTAAAEDLNLYFHDRSWLPDESLLIFTSNREGSREPYGYLETTGGLVRLAAGFPQPTAGFTASRSRNSLFLYTTDAVYEWAIEVGSGDSASGQTPVTVRSRRICTLPEDAVPTGSLSENADASRLSLALQEKSGDGFRLVFIDVSTGKMDTIVRVPWAMQHLQCSWENPERVMFARSYPAGDRMPLMSAQEDRQGEPQARIWFADARTGEYWALYPQVPGELVTHECWWVNDTITFCGGLSAEESHLKVAEVSTQTVRILGVGRWCPGASSAELAKHNWWHASGSPTGDWVAADNFHGDIVLFNARTTHPRPLTLGHRTYGGGAHPHVGWSPSGSRVVFTSNVQGNPDVCVARIKPD